MYLSSLAIFKNQALAELALLMVSCVVNVLEAIKEAKKIGALTVAFTGLPGEPLASACDLAFKAPTKETPRIQEVHIAAWHGICDIIERRVHEQETGNFSGQRRGDHRGSQLPLAS